MICSAKAALPLRSAREYCRTTNSSPPNRASTSDPRTRLRSAIGNGAQQGVAAGVPERVVDLLELVEVDEQKGETGRAASRRRARLPFDRAGAAIGQAV